MQLNYGFYDSPYGQCCMAFTDKGLFLLVFIENVEEALVELKQRLPRNIFVLDNKQAVVLGKIIFQEKKAVELLFEGTPFQQSVWKALRAIPQGTTCTYKEIAATIGKPKAFRAVGSAVGANPIAYLIPCHRVIRTDGNLGGYHWGLERKVRMLKSEGVTIGEQ